jgi:alkylation response protein AidB-like acyl-CoA dehydrogenase
MAWDFSTEPEFQAHLDWMAAFVREEIWPLETLDLDRAQFDRALAPLQAQVRERGLWAAHLPPEHGGQGFGQVKLGLMHEILGTSPYAPSAFGNQAPASPAPTRRPCSAAPCSTRPRASGCSTAASGSPPTVRSPISSSSWP